jgi:carboxyl-terminal processing protease
MVAGPATEGKTFEELTYNDHYPTTSPFDGQPIEPMPFFSEAIGFSVAEGDPLPTLALERVFVLTGPGTCSASESVMNGLRGINIEVIQVGETTCGKPFGYIPQDNCGTTYFSIQFQGVNHKGFGDYADGFSAGAEDEPAGLPGCVVADDFTHQLGDPEEARLAAALAYRADGACPAEPRATRSRLSAIDGEVVKSPWQQSRIYSR